MHINYYEIVKMLLRDVALLLVLFKDLLQKIRLDNNKDCVIELFIFYFPPEVLTVILN